MSLPVPALRIDLASAVPPFEQLRRQLARLVAVGDLPPGTKLPTVRQLALELGLAANTVARSYRGLEADGVVSTEGRRGTFVRSAASSERQDADVERLTRELVATARRAGLSTAETVRLIEQAWTAR